MAAAQQPETDTPPSREEDRTRPTGRKPVPPPPKRRDRKPMPAPGSEDLPGLPDETLLA
jgi:hypothetical protein